MDKALDNFNRIEHLNDNQIKNPASILSRFFEGWHLTEVKAELWELLTAALSSDSNYTRGQDRASVIFFYEETLMLFEAAYLIRQKQSSKAAEKRPQKKKSKRSVNK